MSEGGTSMLAVMPDSYGGRGGIAQYGRDWIDAWTGAGGTATTLTRGEAIDPTRPPQGYHELRVQGRVSLALRAFHETIRRRPDVIVCGHLHYFGLCCGLKRMSGAPLVALAYGIDAYRPPIRGAARMLLAVDAVVAISRHTRRRLLGWADLEPHRVRVLPNAARFDGDAASRTSIAHRCELRRELGIDDRRVLLCLGRMDARERYKGHDVLLEATADLRRDDPSWLLILAGDGSDRARLAARADEIGLGDGVRMEGHVSRERRAALLRAADVFAMPSTQEGFGFVYLEALAAGTPTLAGDRDGARDALRDGELGELVDPTDAGAVRDGILAAIRRPRGVPAALSAFSFDEFQRRLTGVIASLRAPPEVRS